MIESHYGKVMDNNDPDKRGRVKVEAPSLVGKSKELPFWVEPVLVFMGGGKGFFAVPDRDSIVELTVSVSSSSDESAGQTSLDSPNVRYKPVSISDVDTLPTVFSTNYPARRGMSTDAGHWYFDDTTTNKTFHLEHSSGAKIHIDKSGAVFITAATGKNVHINDEAKGAPSVARVGDKTVPHTHTFTLIAGVYGVSGTIHTSEPAIAEGSVTIKGGG